MLYCLNANYRLLNRYMDFSWTTMVGTPGGITVYMQLHFFSLSINYLHDKTFVKSKAQRVGIVYLT